MKKRFVVLGFLAAAALNAALWSEVLHSSSFEAAFLDVGQGDAIYLETPRGHQIVIDGGPDRSVLNGFSKVMPFWDKSLDLLILTHPDADHITGLVHVLEAYRVEQVLSTEVVKDTRVFEAWQKAVFKEGAKEITARKGQQIRWSGHKGEFLEVLYAPEEPRDRTPTNETSIISKLLYGKHSVLFPGDTTEKIEQGLAESGENLEADILKVAHHGSKTSSSREFLEAVAPRTAVISAGKDNKFGHPSLEVLARLLEYGIDIRRTDREGLIIFHFK